MSLITEVENKIRAFAKRVDGEAVKDAERVAADAAADLKVIREAVAKVAPLVSKAQADASVVLARYGPEAITAAQKMLAGIAAEVENLLGDL